MVHQPTLEAPHTCLDYPSLERIWLTSVCAGNELCERLAYYGLATNLVTYITRVMGGDPAFAAILVRSQLGACC